MKKIAILILLTSFTFSCNSTKNSDEQTQNSTSKITQNKEEDNNVYVYYFHYTVRCETCKLVEMLAKDIVDVEYKNKVFFDVYNVEDEYRKKIGESLGVDEQKLLLIKGDKKIDLTSEAFLYADSSPEKFKEIMTQKLDELLQNKGE